MQTARPDISDFVKSHRRISKPESCPALVLNADFRPLSYYPLSLWAWQDTLKAVFLDRVNIVSEYDTLCVRPRPFCSAQRCFAENLRKAAAIRRSHGLTCFCATVSVANIAGPAGFDL